MSENEASEHHRFTLGVYGKPGLGEYDVIVWGRFWTRAFRIATQALEEKLKNEGIKPAIPRQKIKSLREHRTVMMVNDKEEKIQEIENTRKDPKHIDADYWRWEQGYVNGEIEKTADIADLRALGHWTLANQVDSGEITLTEAVEDV